MFRQRHRRCSYKMFKATTCQRAHSNVKNIDCDARVFYGNQHILAIVNRVFQHFKSDVLECPLLLGYVPRLGWDLVDLDLSGAFLLHKNAAREARAWDVFPSGAFHRRLRGPFERAPCIAIIFQCFRCIIRVEEFRGARLIASNRTLQLVLQCDALIYKIS